MAAVNASLDSKIASHDAAFKQWEGKQILGYDKNVCARISRIEATQAGLGAQFAGFQQWQRDFVTRFERKQASDEQNFDIAAVEREDQPRQERGWPARPAAAAGPSPAGRL